MEKSTLLLLLFIILFVILIPIAVIRDRHGLRILRLWKKGEQKSTEMKKEYGKFLKQTIIALAVLIIFMILLFLIGLLVT